MQIGNRLLIVSLFTKSQFPDRQLLLAMPNDVQSILQTDNA